MMNLEDLGKRIKDKRIELNMTQEELAKKSGYTSRSSINKIELGLVDLPQSKIILIAQALGVSVSYLLGKKPMTIGNWSKLSNARNIQRHREKANLSQQQFAELLNLDENTVIKLENGQQPITQEILYNICDVLQLIPSNIIPRDDEELDEDTEYLLSRRNSFGIVPLPKHKKIPLLGTIACGEPIFAEENLDGYTLCPEDVEADFCLRCKGDSMIGARIQDGDIVYIKQQQTIENGEIAAVLIDDEATLKRVYKKGDSIILQPENPAYEPLIFVREEMNEIRILGKAVCFLSKVR